MAEKIRDEVDLLLETLFASTPIEDNGFSDRVVGRVRRKQRFRSVCVSVALVLGSLIALQPAIALLTMLYQLLFDTSTGLFAASADRIPSLTMLVAGGVLAAVLMLGMRLADD
jgi:hypothetical protein